MGTKIYPNSQLEEYKNNQPPDWDAPNRKPTNVCFLTVFLLFLTITAFFIGYCVYFGDINRVIHGYDNCGTTCGDYKSYNKSISCHNAVDDKDFGSLYIVYYKTKKLYDRICTNSCENYQGYKRFINRCLPDRKKAVFDKVFINTGLKDLFVEICEDFEIYSDVFYYMFGIALAISIGFLLLFPFVAGFLVWLVIIGVLVSLITCTVYLWLSWKDLREHKKIDPEIEQHEVYTYLGLSIVFTVVTVIAMLLIGVMIRRVKLVIQLFKEAGRALRQMPLMLIEPLLTFLAIFLILISWSYIFLWITSAGVLTEKRPNVYYYKKDVIMEIAKYVNLFAMLWMIQFVIGCQHLIIAGAVSQWYFARQKSTIVPIFGGFYNLTRYHLGTAALGSFWLATIQFIRLIFYALQRLQNKIKTSSNSINCSCCCQCCLAFLQKVIDMLSTNAYIMTAMHGYGFYKAGQQAFIHLARNPLRVATINSVGDFILFLTKVIVVALSVTISSYFLKSKEGVQHVWVPLVLTALFSYFIAHCFVTVYEMTIDTIFLCFCEDCEMNDGITKPYFMSRGLMEFVDKSSVENELTELPQ